MSGPVQVGGLLLIDEVKDFLVERGWSIQDATAGVAPWADFAAESTEGEATAFAVSCTPSGAPSSLPSCLSLTSH